MEIPIRIKGGNEANIASVHTREPHVSTDARRFRVGSTLVGWPKAEDAVGALSTAGTTTLVVTSGHALHTCVVTVSAGAGAFTRKLVLPLQESGLVDVLDGTFYELLISLPASANPTIEVWNETVASGAAKYILPNAEAEARDVIARFHRTGGVWRFWGADVLGS